MDLFMSDAHAFVTFLVTQIAMLSWLELGRLVGIVFGTIAVVVFAVGYTADTLRARYRRRIVAEAREMVGHIIEGQKRKPTKS